jgi:serine/threonine protein kinase
MTDDELTLSLPGPFEPAGQIGPYRLLQKLGEGGMGEVWEAEQTEPVRRKVALKLIKLGKDSDLEPLQGPDFDALVERARQNAEAQRAK